MRALEKRAVVLDGYRAPSVITNFTEYSICLSLFVCPSNIHDASMHARTHAVSNLALFSRNEDII